jgi:hypothetical protein
MLEREKPKAYKLLMENRITKKRASLLLVFLPSSYMLVLDELLLLATKL